MNGHRGTAGQSRNANSSHAIRAGLSVQELKAMTAMRMAQSNENNNSKPSRDGRFPSVSTASSYQTATPQQLQAAGIQPVVINDKSGPKPRGIIRTGGTLPQAVPNYNYIDSSMNYQPSSRGSSSGSSNVLLSKTMTAPPSQYATATPKRSFNHSINSVQDLKDLTRMRLQEEKTHFYPNPNPIPTDIPSHNSRHSSNYHNHLTPSGLTNNLNSSHSNSAFNHQHGDPLAGLGLSHPRPRVGNTVELLDTYGKGDSLSHLTHAHSHGSLNSLTPHQSRHRGTLNSMTRGGPQPQPQPRSIESLHMNSGSGRNLAMVHPSVGTAIRHSEVLAGSLPPRDSAFARSQGSFNHGGLTTAGASRDNLDMHGGLDSLSTFDSLYSSAHNSQQVPGLDAPLQDFSMLIPGINSSTVSHAGSSPASAATTAAPPGLESSILSSDSQWSMLDNNLPMPQQRNVRNHSSYGFPAQATGSADLGPLGAPLGPFVENEVEASQLDRYLNEPQTSPDARAKLPALSTSPPQGLNAFGLNSDELARGPGKDRFPLLTAKTTGRLQVNGSGFSEHGSSPHPLDSPMTQTRKRLNAIVKPGQGVSPLRDREDSLDENFLASEMAESVLGTPLATPNTKKLFFSSSFDGRKERNSNSPLTRKMLQHEEENELLGSLVEDTSELNLSSTRKSNHAVRN